MEKSKFELKSEPKSFEHFERPSDAVLMDANLALEHANYFLLKEYPERPDLKNPDEEDSFTMGEKIFYIGAILIFCSLAYFVFI